MEFQDFMSKYGTDIQSVTEGYVGKTKATREMEEVVAQMKSDLYGKHMGPRTHGLADAASHPGWKQLEALIKEEFNFKKVIIFPIATNAIPNAMTMPWLSRCNRASLTKMPTKLTKHGEFWKDDQSYITTFWFFTDLLYHLEPDEFVGVILHEVGHNFDIMQASFCADYFAWLFWIHDNIVERVLDVVKLFHINTIQVVSSFTIWSYLSKLGIIRLFNTINTLFIEAQKIVGLASNPFKVGADMIIGTVGGATPAKIAAGIYFSTMGYAKEDWADSFASVYGYGPAMISAMDKMDYLIKEYKFFRGNDSAVARALNEACYVHSTLKFLTLMLFDPHQETQTRVRKILDDLEKTAKDKNMPKETRKLILRDVEVARKNYAKFVKGTDINGRETICKGFLRGLIESGLDGKIDFRTYLFRVNAMSDPRALENEDTLDDSSIEASTTEESTQFVIDTINKVNDIKKDFK